jgi:HSP20 family protein
MNTQRMDIRRLAAPSAWDLMERVLHDRWPALAAGRGEGGVTSDPKQVLLNAWEAQDGYHLALMAPGADPSAISITAAGATLTVEGELTVETPEGARPLWREFGAAKFRRSIQLPDAINAAGVEAYCKNGLLFISVPKAEHAKPRSITVKAHSPVEVKAHSPVEQALPAAAPKGKQPAR